MKKALCIGHATYDITVPVEEYPKENTKYYVDSIIECGGGSAANAAALLSMWQTDTFFAGVIGNDTYGKAIEKEFQKAGVNLEYLEKQEEVETGYSFILINEENASRTLFNHSNKNFKLQNMNINIQPDLILIDTYETEFAKNAINNNPNSITIIDAGKFKPEINEISHMVDYFVCSRGFAEDFTKTKININDPESIRNVYNTLESEFKNKIVITLGEEGSIYKDDNEIKTLGIYKTEAKDTTGAGDIFHGAFAYCLLQGFDIEKTMKIASITSALSVRTYGGRNSIPKLEEVMELYNNNVL